MARIKLKQFKAAVDAQWGQKEEQIQKLNVIEKVKSLCLNLASPLFNLTID